MHCVYRIGQCTVWLSWFVLYCAVRRGAAPVRFSQVIKISLQPGNQSWQPWHNTPESLNELLSCIVGNVGSQVLTKKTNVWNKKVDICPPRVQQCLKGAVLNLLTFLIIKIKTKYFITLLFCFESWFIFLWFYRYITYFNHDLCHIKSVSDIFSVTRTKIHRLYDINQLWGRSEHGQ